jgi:hypothetical protein
VNTTSGAAIGASTISITCASTVAAGFYNQGYLMVASGAGQGLTYQINNHAAVSTGATGAFKLYDDDALAVAITTTSTISLLANKYANVIQAPVTTATGVVVGVASYAIGATQFGWVQTWGVCAVRGGDTNALGTQADGISSTAGRVRALLVSTVVPAATTSQTVASSSISQPIGILMQTNVDGQFVAIDLRIAP